MSKIKVGIVGAGTMGAGIAQVASEAGHEVLLFDTDSAAQARAGAKLEKIMDRLVEKGRRTREQTDGIIGRIAHVTEISAFADVGLVVEAIIENFEIKRSLFQDLMRLLVILVFSRQIHLHYPLLPSREVVPVPIA